MALPITQWGSLRRSRGLIAAILKQSKLVHFGAVEKLSFSFDPFGEEQSTKTIRDALHHIVLDKTRITNPKVSIKTDILSDRSEPLILANLTDGSRVKFKTENLTTLEILTLFNELVSAKAPKKTEVTIVQTKGEKAGAKKSSPMKKR